MSLKEFTNTEKILMRLKTQKPKTEVNKIRFKNIDELRFNQFLRENQSKIRLNF